MRRPWIIWAGLALLALVALFLIFQPHGDSKKENASGQNVSTSQDQRGGGGSGRRGGGRRGLNGPMPVSAAPVEKSEIRITRSALGTVTPLATATVHTQIAGQLIAIDFQEGQMVAEGDVLAEVDPQPYQHALQQAQGQLARDQALLREAQVNLARYQKLMKEDSIARQQLDTQSSLVKQYQGVVVTDKAALDNARLNLSRCHITAPISGRAGLRQVDRGNYVQTGDANGVVVITQLSPVSVVFTLPEDDLGAVMARMKAGATLEATAFDRTNSTQLATGKLTAVDSQIDPTTGTVKLRAEFANEDQKLFPNQFVNVTLLVDVLQDATVIPAAAIQRGTDGTFVYAVKPDNTVAMKPVKTGVADGDRIQITEGELNPGDQVVVDGADKLKDGAKIALPAPEAQNGEKPGAPEGESKGGHRRDGSGATNDTKEPSPANPAMGVDAKTPGTPASAEVPAAPGAQGTPDNGAPSAAFGQKKETDAPAGNPPVSAPALGRSAQ